MLHGKMYFKVFKKISKVTGNHFITTHSPNIIANDWDSTIQLEYCEV